jgi:hypothetical protein
MRRLLFSVVFRHPWGEKRRLGGTLYIGMAAGSGRRKIKGGGGVLPIVTWNWVICDCCFRTKNKSRGAGSSVLAASSRVEEVGDFPFRRLTFVSEAVASRRGPTTRLIN